MDGIEANSNGVVSGETEALRKCLTHSCTEAEQEKGG